MDHGENYYDAFRDAFGIERDPPSEARDFRPPLPFLVWRLVPFDSLYTSYLVLVVGATSLILLFACVAIPIAVIPVTLFLLFAGRLPRLADDRGVAARRAVDGSADRRQLAGVEARAMVVGGRARAAGRVHPRARPSPC